MIGTRGSLAGLTHGANVNEQEFREAFEQLWLGKRPDNCQHVNTCIIVDCGRAVEIDKSKRYCSTHRPQAELEGYDS